METITKKCATCGKSFTIKELPQIRVIEPDDCCKCALAKDAKWREDNKEMRAQMAREMMAKLEPITPLP